jgi:hypothetical protein
MCRVSSAKGRVTVRVGDEISQWRRELAQGTLSAAEQPKQFTTNSLAVGGSRAVRVFGRKNLRAPSAYRRRDERPDLFG